MYSSSFYLGNLFSIHDSNWFKTKLKYIFLKKYKLNLWKVEKKN